ncbi:putative integral membrane protein [Babesia bovis T2Bo]|uniref:Uncharacterized protein n=1 Tax=Babesia bovis TaxID=5865 RepID=A7ARX4_BABBO|nr:putative integral membrane protein [Babesia bovis T2Bo]EDO07293.1 putative integral membrane protein [Babesia bovis T2Bo]|eukprot:XP_001610861.1 hypothetical protein [Babesia bovis T2Bo]
MFRRTYNHISRTILLKGSPANKIATWSLGISISLVWIYISEKRNPRAKGIFFRKKEAEIFTEEEIAKWNEKFKPKSI